MNRVLAALLIVVGVTGMLGQAAPAAKSDFSGTWKLSARWTLSDDGKVMTKVTTFSLGQGEFTTTTVFEKN